MPLPAASKEGPTAIAWKRFNHDPGAGRSPVSEARLSVSGRRVRSARVDREGNRNVFDRPRTGTTSCDDVIEQREPLLRGCDFATVCASSRRPARHREYGGGLSASRVECHNDLSAASPCGGGEQTWDPSGLQRRAASPFEERSPRARSTAGLASARNDPARSAGSADAHVNFNDKREPSAVPSN